MPSEAPKLSGAQEFTIVGWGVLPAAIAGIALLVFVPVGVTCGYEKMQAHKALEQAEMAMALAGNLSPQSIAQYKADIKYFHAQGMDDGMGACRLLGQADD